MNRATRQSAAASAGSRPVTPRSATARPIGRPIRTGRRAAAGWVGIAAAVLVVIIGTGCAQTTIEVSVNSDHSVVMTFDVIPDRDSYRQIERSGYLDQMEAALEDLDGATFSDVNVEGRDGYRLSVPHNSIDDVAEMLTPIPGAPPGTNIPLFSTFSVTERDGADGDGDEGDDDGGDGGRDSDGGSWEFRATSLSVDATVRALVVQVAGEADPGPLFDDPDAGLYFTMTMPGVVSDTNGEADRSSATWALHELPTGTELVLDTEPEGFPTRTQLIVGGAIAGFVLLIVLLSVLARIRRSRRAAARADRVAALPYPVVWQPPAGPDASGAPAWPGTPGAAGAAGAAAGAGTAGAAGGAGPHGPGASGPPIGPSGQPTGAPRVGASPIGGAPAGLGGGPTLSGTPGGDPNAAVLFDPGTGRPLRNTAVQPSVPTPQPEPPTPSDAAVSPGWYPDPTGEAAHRWWTGTGWSDHTG